ncbi:MAG TPA: tetratricopeptide repeat protein [Candidatus Limnocylindrales bacterium]|jgi:TPR repeat protein|nr:tetratricopeptide repeat protein [Candidatus Limnocylindrales bacterium]
MKALRLCLWTIIAFATVSGAIAEQKNACPRNDAEFASVQQRAQAKDATAQTTLASCYDLGMHVSPDGKESIRLLGEAANQGYAPAEYELGRIYLYGRGIPADYAKALTWVQKAADQGNPRAQRDLAFMYERGLGVTADPARAAEWNRKAAAQGNSEAQLQLARALDQGSGVDKNPAEARRWYAKATGAEQPAAQLALARKSLAQGNCTGAIHWFEEAAEHGEAEAMFGLGELYRGGKCPRNSERALLWFTLGGRFGMQESKDEAAKLAGTLALSTNNRVNSRAEEWIKAHLGAQKEEEEEEER